MIIDQCQLSFCENHDTIGDTFLCLKHYKTYKKLVTRQPKTTLKSYVQKAELENFIGTLGECLIDGCHKTLPKNHKRGLCINHLHSFRNYYKGSSILGVDYENWRKYYKDKMSKDEYVEMKNGQSHKKRNKQK